MSYLIDLPNPNPKWKFWLWGRRYYYLPKEFTWYSERYKKSITVESGRYDGATWAFDTEPRHGNPPSWLVHDQVCNKPYFDDGTPITAKQAAQILSDLLKDNGHSVRAFTWKHATYYFGCKKARHSS